MSHNFSGLDALIAGLDAAVGRALDKTAEAVRRGAAARTKGQLAQSIHVLADSAGSVQFREILADKPYAQFVENGRRAFEMRDKILHFVINGRDVFCRSVKAAKARPFMKPMRAPAKAWLEAMIKSEVGKLTIS